MRLVRSVGRFVGELDPRRGRTSESVSAFDRRRVQDPLDSDSCTKRGEKGCFAVPDARHAEVERGVQWVSQFSKRPATVVRQATLKVKKLLDDSKAGSSKQSRHILRELWVLFSPPFPKRFEADDREFDFRSDGGAGTGKSTLMLQAVSYAQASGYVVFYLPSGEPFSLSFSDAFARAGLNEMARSANSNPSRQLVHPAHLLATASAFRSTSPVGLPLDETRDRQQGNLQGAENFERAHFYGWRFREEGRGWKDPRRVVQSGRRGRQDCHERL